MATICPASDTYSSRPSGSQAKCSRKPFDFGEEGQGDLTIGRELRLALRSGDIYVEHARRYADPNTYLIPPDVWPAQREEVIRLTHTPADGSERLRERETQLRHLAERVERLLAEREGWLRREKGKWVLSPWKRRGGRPLPRRWKTRSLPACRAWISPTS